MRLAIACVLLAPTVAWAAPDFVPERVVVVGHVGSAAWTDAPTEARLDQQAELAPVVLGHRGRRRVALAPDGISRIRIAGQALATEPLTGARIQWSTVEPHSFRVTPAMNGATSEFYSNVSTEPKTFGRWIGYDHIDYYERVVQPWGAPAVIHAEVTSGEPGAQQVPKLGTIRYKVAVELGGVALASPGAEATDTAGVLPAVHRVSIRRGDDFLGQLSAFLLVPEVFGSAGGGKNHQTERFTGADCADVMVGAARKLGRPLAFTNVEGLPRYARPIGGVVELDDHGQITRPIAGVLPGDLIRLDFASTIGNHSPRGWDHVAALWEDRSDPAGPAKGGPDGQLDGFDLVIHMGHPRLVIEPLSAQGPATIDVLRWRGPK
jgi:hypothetical protein